MRLRFLTAMGLAACVALAAAAPVAALAEDTYSVMRKFKAGEVDRYKTTLDIEAAGGMKVQIVFATTEKTVEIKDDGTMTRSITVDSAEFVMNGQAMQMPGFKPATITSSFDKDGKAIKEEGEAGQFRQMLSMTRPTAAADKPLKVGEEWKTEVPTNKDGTKKLNVTVTLVGLEPKSETLPAETYKIKSVADGTVESPQGDQKLRLESVSHVTRDTGKPLRIEGTVNGINIPQFGAAKIAFKVVRQPDAAAAPAAK